MSSQRWRVTPVDGIVVALCFVLRGVIQYQLPPSGQFYGNHPGAQRSGLTAADIPLSATARPIAPRDDSHQREAG